MNQDQKNTPNQKKVPKGPLKKADKSKVNTKDNKEDGNGMNEKRCITTPNY